MESGGQPGNRNAAKGKRWQQAIERALEKRGKGNQIAALDDLAEKLLTLCDRNDLAAIKELGDRLDGKSHQSVGTLNPDGSDAPIGFAVSFVGPIPQPTDTGSIP